MTNPEMIRCLRCLEKFERLKANGHFCEGCAEAVDREKSAERSRDLRERALLMIESVPGSGDWIPSLDGEKLEEIGLATENGDPSILIDGVIEGANSPAGPDEGRSTFFKDLRGELDTLSGKAAEDPWWQNNPHVFYAVHDPAEAAKYNLAPWPRCGDQAGTDAGYQRHKHAKEMPCPPCTKAHREYMKRYRSAA